VTFPRSVASGQVLSLSGHTLLPNGQVSVTFQVTTIRISYTGSGKHRHRLTRTVVLYNVVQRVQADRHGAFSARLRITYQTKKPVKAGILVTVSARHRTVTAARSTASINILPPLLTVAIPRTITGGDILRLSGQTLPNGQVGVSFQVTTIRITYTGSGKQRRRVTRIVMLYSASNRTTVDRHGAFSARLRIAYQTKKPIKASIVVTVSAQHSKATAATSAADINVLPRPASPSR